MIDWISSLPESGTYVIASMYVTVPFLGRSTALITPKELSNCMNRTASDCEEMLIFAMAVDSEEERIYIASPRNERNICGRMPPELRGPVVDVTSIPGISSNIRQALLQFVMFTDTLHTAGLQTI